MADSDQTEPPEQSPLIKALQSVLCRGAKLLIRFPTKLLPLVGPIEALLWIGGLVMLQYVISEVVAILPVVLLRVFPEPRGAAEPALPSDGMEGFLDRYAPLHVTEIFLEATIIVVCIWLRLGRPALEWRRPRFTTPQLGLFLAGIAPVATFSTFVYDWIEAIIKANAVGWFAIDPWSSMQLQLAYFSAPTAIALYAATPAVVEEVIFRRFVGEGLTSHLGTIRGILLTSALFGLWHWYLPHVASSFVTGIFLHLTYLKTRSLLAPILVHFANNTVWIVLTKNSMERDGFVGGWDFEAPVGSPSFLLGGFAFAASVVTGLALSATSPRRLANDQAPVENADNPGTCPTWLFVLATVGNVTFCGLWIHEFLRAPRFQ